MCWEDLKKDLQENVTIHILQFQITLNDKNCYNSNIKISHFGTLENYIYVIKKLIFENKIFENPYNGCFPTIKKYCVVELWSSGYETGLQSQKSGFDS